MWFGVKADGRRMKDQLRKLIKKIFSWVTNLFMFFNGTEHTISSCPNIVRHS